MGASGILVARTAGREYIRHLENTHAYRDDPMDLARSARGRDGTAGSGG